MKNIILICLIVLFYGCNQKINDINSFSSGTDTLYLESVKIKGHGIFDIGAGPLAFRDTCEWKNLDWFDLYPDYHFVCPDSIKELKLGFLYLMLDSFEYFDKTNNKVYTQQNYSLAERQILLVLGKKNNTEVLIIDDNNNKDLRDDSVRQIEAWDWNSNNKLIDIKYQIDNGKTIVKDTGWYKIGNFHNNLLHYISQHLISNFKIDNIKYSLQVADDNPASFSFFEPMIYLVSNNGIKRDTLMLSDIVKQGEYIKLGQFHYKFHKLYDGCGTIVLAKEKNFDKLIGTQVGMIAPEFTCKTVRGDSINSSNLKGKAMVIVNSCGCGGDLLSTQAYYDICEKYGNETHIFRLDSRINKDLEGLQIDTEEESNKDIYKKYRNAYCSRTCYLINREGRIEDKFDVRDWETSLSEYLD